MASTRKSSLIQRKKTEAQIDAIVRRIRHIAIAVLAVGIVVLAGLFMLLSNNLKKQAGVKQAAKPTIALVDEDENASFNKQNYNFGQNFVKLVSNDNKYNWQVVSRAVADKAYKDKSIDAVIYIPQNFSHNILTLQDIDPTKAEVDYKVLDGSSQLSERLLQDKITNILYDFNQNIVKMYYASVAGNVAEAQGNMSSVVGSQGNLLTQLNNNVYGPFQTTNQNYSSVISVAGGLKSMNTSWIQAQNAFTNSTKQMLQSESSSLNNELTPLDSYFTTQKQIADLNVVNGNKGMTNQATSDKTAYFNLYTTLNQTALDGLSGFYKNDTTTGETTGDFVNLQKQVNSYNTIIGNVNTDLQKQKSKLDAKRSDLYALESRLYQQYFNQPSSLSITNSNFDGLHDIDKNPDNARAAMAQMILKSFQYEDHTSDYIEQLKALLNKVSWNVADYKALFDALEKNGSLTAETRANYESEIGLLSNMGNALGATQGGVDVDTVPTDSTNQTVSGSLKITVPAGTSYKLTLPSGLDNFQLNATDAGMTMNADGTVTLTNDDTSDVVSPEGEAKPTGQPRIFTLPYSVNLGDKTTATLDFEWVNTTDSSDSYQSTATLGLIPENVMDKYAGQSDFEKITQLLNNLDTTANFINFIYGAPGKDSSYKDLLSKTTIEDFEKASPKSVYSLYGNLDLGDSDTRLTQLEKQLSETDVNTFQQTGQKTIQDVIDTIKTLNLTLDGGKDADGVSIDGLNADIKALSDHLPNDYFKDTLDALQTWYTDTENAIDTQYKTWKDNPTVTLPEKAWEDRQEDETALYYDKADSDSLYKTISEMVTNSAKTADETAKSAQAIKDNSDEFDSLVKTVTETQDSAKKVIDNTGSLLNNGNGDLANNKNYANNFASVLANTRTAGANPNNIFDFFAKPLAAKDVTPKAKAAVSTKGFDWRWLIIFVGGIFIGVLGMLVQRSLMKRNEEILDEQEE